MKIWAPMVLTAALVTSIGMAPVANADPPRNDRDGRNDHPGGPMQGPRIQDPRQPGGGPPRGELRGEPRLEPREYQARLTRLQDDRFAQRQALRRDERGWENSRAQRELEHRRQLEGSGARSSSVAPRSGPS